MKKKLLLSLTFSLVVFVALVSLDLIGHSVGFSYAVIPSVFAQADTCPNGTSTIASLNFQLYNGSLVKWGCIDLVTGNVLIGGTVYATSNGISQAMALSGGGEVISQSGNYTISATINIPAGVTLKLKNGTLTLSPSVTMNLGGNNASLSCEGTVLFASTDHNANGLITNTAGVTDIAVRGCEINGNQANQSVQPSPGANGVYINDAQRVTVENTYVHDTRTDGIKFRKVVYGWIRDNVLRNTGKPTINAQAIKVETNSAGETTSDIEVTNNLVDTVTGTGNGIFLVRSAGTAVTRVNVSDNIVKSAADEGIEVQLVDNVRVADNIIFASASANIYVRQSSNVTVQGNQIDGNGLGLDGVNVDTQGTTSISRVSVVGNNIRNIPDNALPSSCIKVTTGGAIAINDVLIAGNVCSQAGRQSIVASGSGIEKLNISGNTVTGAATIGIYLNAMSGDSIVTNNLSYNNGTLGAGTRAGIRVFDSTRGIIANNFTFDDQGSPTQTHGILVDGTSGDWTVNSNIARGNITANFSFTGSGGNIRVFGNSSAATIGAVFGDTLFANLGTPENGTVTFCSDCTFANPCAGAGTGAIAKRLNGAWRCD